jgi:hypothetical protein
MVQGMVKSPEENKQIMTARKPRPQNSLYGAPGLTNDKAMHLMAA